MKNDLPENKIKSIGKDCITFIGSACTTSDKFEIFNRKLDTGNNIISLSLEKDLYPEFRRNNKILSYCENRHVYPLWRKLHNISRNMPMEKNININNMPMIKILIIAHYEYTFNNESFEYFNNMCKFHNLPPSIDKIYIPTIIKYIYTEDLFRLPYGCKIVYYNDYNDILELDKNNLYKIHFIEE